MDAETFDKMKSEYELMEGLGFTADEILRLWLAWQGATTPPTVPPVSRDETDDEAK